MIQNHCFKVRKSSLLCWNKVLHTDKTKMVEAFSSPELTLTQNGLAVIGKGSVEGKMQHRQAKVKGNGESSTNVQRKEKNKEAREGDVKNRGKLLEREGKTM